MENKIVDICEKPELSDVDTLVWQEEKYVDKLKIKHVSEIINMFAEIDVLKKDNERLRYEKEKIVKENQSVYNKLKTGYMEIDKSGKILFINSYGGFLFRLQTEELTGRNITDLISESERESFINLITDTFDNQNSTNANEIIITTLHAITCIKMNLTLMSSYDKVSLIFVGDPECCRNLPALPMKKDQFETLSELLPSGIWQSDTEGNIVYVNNQWSEITGILYAEAINTKWWDYIVSDDISRVIDNWIMAGEISADFHSEFSIIKPNGDLSYIMCTARLIKHDYEETPYWIGTFTDINIAKQHNDIKNEQQELNMVRARYFDQYDLDPVGYCTLSDKGLVLEKKRNIVEINHIAAVMFGESRSAMIDKPLSAYIYVRDIGLYFAARAKLYESDEPQICELRMLKTDDSFFWVSMEITATQDDAGEFVCRVVITDISERKKSEESIWHAKWCMESIIEGTGAGTWEWNIETGETVFNEKWAEIIGYKLHELMPLSIKTWEKFVHPDDLAQSIDLINRHFRGELPYYRCECRMKHKNGHWVWVLDRGQVITRNEDNKPLMMFGTHTDITEKMIYEEKLKANETNFRLFVESMPDMIIVCSIDGNILYANNAVIDTLSYNEEEIKRMHFSEIHPKEMRTTAANTIKKISINKHKSVISQMVAKNKTVIPVKTNVWLSQWNGEKCIFILSENQLEEEENQRKFESLFRKNPTMMAITNVATLAITDINDSFMYKFGYSKDDISGKTIDDINLFPDHNQYDKLVGDLSEYGKVSNLELQVRCKAGNIINILYSGEIIKIHGEKYCLSVLTDIDVRIHEENNLKKSEQQFRYMFERHSAVMLLIDAESGRIINANQSAINFYGYDNETICKMNINAINMLSDNSIAEEYTKAIFERKNYFVFPHKLSNGEIRQVEVYSSPIAYQGKFLLFSIIHDITNRQNDYVAMSVQHELSISLGSSSDIQKSMRDILDAAMQMDGIDCGGIYLVNNSGGLDLIANHGLSDEFVNNVRSYSVNDPQTVLAREGKIIYSRYNDIHTDKNPSHFNEGLQGIAVIPVLHDNQLVALLNLSSHTHSEIPLYTRNTLEMISRQVGSILIRLQTDAEMDENRNNLQQLFDKIDDFLFVLDMEGNIILANDTVYMRLGYDKNEVYGKNVLMFHPENRREETREIIDDMLNGIRDFCPVPLQSKDGTLIPVETRVTFGLWSGKTVLFGISRDITERTIAENILKEQKKRLDNIIDATNVGTWEWNIQTGETVFCEKWANMLGYELNELAPTTFETWEMFVHPDDFEYAKNLLMKHFTGELPFYDCECRMKHKNGDLMWVQTRGRVITFTEDNKPLMMFGTHADITARKKSEEELQKAMNDIRTLRGIVPICASCKKIRDDKGFWNQVEVYIRDHTEAEFSHGLCPDCVSVLYPDLVIDD